MTDLSKIDWTKCKLPRWQNRELSAQFVAEGIHIVSADWRLRRPVAVKVTELPHGNRGKWTLDACATFEEIEELVGHCRHVDSFIASELKRIEEENLPPWRECTLEEAMANPECSEYFNATTEDFEPMSEYAGPSCRTRAPKPEPKQSTTQAPRSWTGTSTIVNSTYDGGQVIVLDSATRIPCPVNVRYRLEEVVDEPKPDPEPQSVKAPDGREWRERFGDLHCKTGGDFPIPRTKSIRDAMLACVAAYDEAHGIKGKTVSLVTQRGRIDIQITPEMAEFIRFEVSP